MNKPLIIALTGLDGSGKSSLCRELKNQMLDSSVHIVSLWDSMAFWEDSKKVIAYFDTLRGAARTHFIFQAYHHSLNMTLKKLNSESENSTELPIVLLDGYWYKYAATEIAYGMDSDWILNLAKYFPTPDLVFCLNVDPSLALSRKTHLSRYEQGLAADHENSIGFVDFQKIVSASWSQVRQGVEASKGEWIDLDGSRSLIGLSEEVIGRIEDLSLQTTPQVRPGLTRDLEGSRSHRVSISGIDGTGKTTLIRALTKRYQQTPEEAFPIRSPQFHEDSRLPLGGLSEAFDLLGNYADRTGNPLLKAASLFFSMSLYGSIERTIQAIYRPKVLFVERQCILDTLAYGEFYLPQLNQGSGSGPANQSMKDLVQEVLGLERAGEVESWFKTLRQRDPQFRVDWNSLLSTIAYVFSGKPHEVVARLLRIYHAELPDQIVLLTLSPEALQVRSQMRRSGEEVTIELHEQAETLGRLAQAQKRAAFLLKSIKPSLEIVELCTENQSVEESLGALLSHLNRFENKLRIAVG